MSFPLSGQIFHNTPTEFNKLALELYRHQYDCVSIYKQYCNAVGRLPSNTASISQIPFLPVSFFKSHTVIAEGMQAQYIFESSTTTGASPSRHLVADIALYQTSYRRAFELFYGSPSRYIFLALLPSYIDRGNSSLLHMVDDLIGLSAHPLSQFFNADFDRLSDVIAQAQATDRIIFLIGVTYALLDFAATFPMDLSTAIVLETGGMKGRRAEMTRSEVHHLLSFSFQVDHIHSEYGMTELLSQAYSIGEGIFCCPPWMKVLIRDPYDPFSYLPSGRVGAINIIDLANVNSCSFLAVSDLGRVYDDGSFDVLGRMDSADVRGCNLLYEG